ncbi:MAG: hypothetical protein JWM90_80 [Thermoleophilia bacterium]|nr:hypothetical protein [Thermoleophilia bacterium]
MDEWAQQQGQPGHQQHGAPWHGAQPHQPEPARPGYGQAPSGFVLPGAPAGQAPLGFQGGLIGVPEQDQQQPSPQPQQYAQPQQPQQPLQFQPQAQAPQQMQYQQPATQQHMQPQGFSQAQAWAYPTPQGMQLVQGGPVAYAAAPPMYAQHPQQPQQPQLQQHVGGASAVAGTTRRLRWETIIPVAATFCFFAAVALLISDFDRITGRAAPAATVTDARTITNTDPDASMDELGDVEATLAEGEQLRRDGRYEEATARIAPSLKVESPDPRLTKLTAAITFSKGRNTALLAKLGRQRQAADWTGVIQTIKVISTLHPLSADLVKIRSQALAKVKATAATRTAKARAAAAARAARPAGATGGGAPAPGGQSRATTSVAPPRSAQAPASAPKPPGVANPGSTGGGGVSGQPVVTPVVTPVVVPTAPAGTHDHPPGMPDHHG